MKDLSLHIENLLLDHDCVIYPQLGAFTTTYIPSKWSEEEDLFLPPCRMVSFDAEVNEGDELFVTSLAKRYRVSKTDASMMCAEYLDYIRQELSENGTMDLGSIGVFVQENEQEPILFYPTPAGVASPRLYGLDALHLAPISNPQQFVSKRKKDRPIFSTADGDENHITIRISRQFAGYVATAAACILLFFALANPIQNSDKTIPQTAETEFLVPGNLIPTLNKSTEKSSPSQVPTDSVSEEESIDPATTESLTEENTTENYAVVLASAVSMKNAEAFASRLQEEGYNAEVFVKNNMVRVIIQGFHSEGQVYEQIREMKAKNPRYSKAWSLRLE